jgi:hypothetical protein
MCDDYSQGKITPVPPRLLLAFHSHSRKTRNGARQRQNESPSSSRRRQTERERSLPIQSTNRQQIFFWSLLQAERQITRSYLLLLVERLDWRLDPAESLSDWTIQIVVSGATAAAAAAAATTDYYVHKNVLAVGARKSEYFGRLFLGCFAEAANCTSRIELHPLAATAFPAFLDYVYSDELKISTETTTAAHYLAGNFENRRLRWEAKQFWKRDLAIATAGTYYEHSELFRDDKIATAVADLCVAQIDAISHHAGSLHCPAVHAAIVA